MAVLQFSLNQGLQITPDLPFDLGIVLSAISKRAEVNDSTGLWQSENLSYM